MLSLHLHLFLNKLTIRRFIYVQILAVEDLISFDQEFRWFVNHHSLMDIQVNVDMHMIDQGTHFDSVCAKSSIIIGDVYMHKPVSIWLTLTDPNQVIKF